MQYDSSVAGLFAANTAARESLRENQGRWARCVKTWTTTGVGETRSEEAIAFDLRFVEEPAFTTGFALDASTDLVANHYPRVSCGVYEWHLDNKGNYVGAWVFFTVDTEGPGAIAGVEPNYKIHHHLKWEGSAIKDVPAYLLDTLG